MNNQDLDHDRPVQSKNKEARLGGKLVYHTGHQLSCTDVLLDQAELEATHKNCH